MNNPIIAIDGHVHVHPTSDVDSLLSAACRNLAQVAKAQGAGTWRGVLMLAEMREARWFESALGAAPAARSWSVQAAPGDPLALNATSAEGELTIVAGRQVVTSEGIEVLTLATRTVLNDGMSLGDTLNAAHAARALVVLPWGAGKWLGARGRMVESALQADSQRSVFAGDNGGRPQFWPTPGAFGTATRLGRAVLPGTDPLPLPGEEQRVGSFGFWIEGPPSAATGSALRDRLVAGAEVKDVHAFGRLQGPWQFVRNQAALRMRNKQSRRTS